MFSGCNNLEVENVDNYYNIVSGGVSIFESRTLDHREKDGCVYFNPIYSKINELKICDGYAIYPYENKKLKE